MNIQDWFPLGLTDLIFLQFKGLSRVFSGSIFLWQIGKQWKQGQTWQWHFLYSKIIVDGDCSLKIKRPCSLEKRNDKLRQHVKKQRHYFANKGQYSQSYHFSSSHVQMWELDSKKDWVLKNSCFWTVVLKKTAKSPLDSKEIKPVNPKGNQPWIFIGRTDAEAEAPVFWLWANSLENTLMFSKIEGRRRRGWLTDDEMFGRHHWLSGYEFELTPGDGGGQEGLVCCSPWGHKESDTTEQLHNNKFMGHQPGRYGIWFYCDCAPPTISL